MKLATISGGVTEAAPSINGEKPRMEVHPHPRQTEVGIFFASFGKSRISVSRGHLKRLIHLAKRQWRSVRSESNETSGNFGISRIFGNSRIGLSMVRCTANKDKGKAGVQFGSLNST